MIDTKVYTASVECLKDPELYQRALERIPANRRESADRMKPESGKRLAAGAGLLLVAAFAEWLRENLPCAVDSGRKTETQNAETQNAEKRMLSQDILDLQQLRFAQGEYGKPYLPDFPEIHFNLSHSGSRVMCIVSTVEVGCDVEQIEPKRVGSVIRCLAESEQCLVKDSAQTFFRIWTLKESFMKLTGKGFQIPFKSFEVSLDPLSVKQDYIAEPVRLKEYAAFRNGDEAERYCCSCAVAGSEVELPDEMIEVDLAGVLARLA